ncbi:hypothetical protein AXF42_Ash018033 [Apostasia shenzhenica]|uniref:Uncharacterized protein n=1 Tax=Apostasia shenzhenica TaxID=1088818 RepID=A0A2I0AVL8_9ASPA|nr:hypothetical protein AXF42_Ash018033 [Apostasia shenzhenica]
MSDGESQRQLLLMIRDFAVEKTHGDRRVSDLKKRLLELQDEYEAANADFEKAKLAKEFAERDLRESQAQLGRTSASLLAMEARISGLQNDMSHASSELHALKNVAEIHRDEFMRAMLEFNCDIRTFVEGWVFNRYATHWDGNGLMTFVFLGSILDQTRSSIIDELAGDFKHLQQLGNDRKHRTIAILSL